SSSSSGQFDRSRASQGGGSRDRTQAGQRPSQGDRGQAGQLPNRPGDGNPPQVIEGERGTAIIGDEGFIASGERGAMAAGQRGAIATGERGTVASGERGAIATGERGTVASGERGAIAAGERGVVASGERGALAANREGDAIAVGDEGFVVSDDGNIYGGEWNDLDNWDDMYWYDDDWYYWDDWYVWDDYDEWVLFAGVTTGIAIGTLLAEPPAEHTIIYVAGVPYYYSDTVFYAPVMQGTTVVYQVIPPPIGAIVPGLPAGCTEQDVNGVTHYMCGGAAYIEDPGGYQVVVDPTLPATTSSPAAPAE
ncbi:MAG TPA: DUF6515 family protein, partial [Gemmatimonadota bacterium]|nr:DUF6515 family protein [Gemmatimonadota bacterium]